MPHLGAWLAMSLANVGTWHSVDHSIHRESHPTGPNAAHGTSVPGAQRTREDEQVAHWNALQIQERRTPTHPSRSYRVRRLASS